MTPTFEQQSLLVFIVGLFAVLGAVASFTAILKNIALYRATKKPSPEESAVREFATKSELSAFRCDMQRQCQLNHERVDETFKEIFSVLRDQQESILDKLNDVKNWQTEIGRMIGNLEGRLNR